MSQYGASNPYQSPSVAADPVRQRFPWGTTAVNGLAAVSPGVIGAGFNGIAHLPRFLVFMAIFLTASSLFSLFVASTLRLISRTPFWTRFKQSLLVFNVLLGVTYLVLAYAVLRSNLSIHCDVELPGF